MSSFGIFFSNKMQKLISILENPEIPMSKLFVAIGMISTGWGMRCILETATTVFGFITALFGMIMTVGAFILWYKYKWRKMSKRSDSTKLSS